MKKKWKAAVETQTVSVVGRRVNACTLCLQVLLVAHRGWFRKQRCQDVFQKLLGIDVLRQGDSVPLSTPNGNGASTVEGGGPARRESEEGRTEGGVCCLGTALGTLCV